MSLNSQFNAVLNGIIRFSVRFCDNSQLKMLKNAFSGLFFRKQKGTRVLR